jgi:hypothetical protein
MAHLDGLPGFTASVDYSVTAIASKTKNIKLGIGVTCVSFPLLFLFWNFVYRSASLDYH